MSETYQLPYTGAEISTILSSAQEIDSKISAATLISTVTSSVNMTILPNLYFSQAGVNFSNKNINVHKILSITCDLTNMSGTYTQQQGIPVIGSFTTGENKLLNVYVYAFRNGSVSQGVSVNPRIMVKYLT